MATIMRCTHRQIRIRTERDRCSWVECMRCSVVGPKKHTYTHAVLAFLVATINQHPRKKR